jgi:hypothetical protein
VAYTFDGPNKRINLSLGTTDMSVRDVWSRWADWVALSDNSKYLPAFSNLGGDDIDPGAGTKIPIYAFMLNGWRIKPQEAHHTLNITDGILLVDGAGDPFVNTTGSYIVRINYQQPVQAISFSTDGGGAAPVGPTSYAPTSATRVSGDNDGGDVSDLAALDDVRMSTGELSISPGIEVVVTVDSSDTDEAPSLCRITGVYIGGSGHTISIQAYNYVTDSWATRGTMLTRLTPFDYVIPLGSEYHDPSTGEMQLRFLHSVGTYIATHVLHLDWVSFEKISTDDQISADVAAIRAKTDQLNFEFANVLAAMNDTEKAEVANTVWSNVLIGGTITASQLMQVITAALAGKLSGAGTSLVKIRDLEDTKDIITAAVDSSGNRLTVTLDL